METRFYIQDPYDPNTTYLYEAIVSQIMQPTLIAWRGLYSFVTGNGVQTIFRSDPAVSSFMGRGQVSLLIGIDAVTNVTALEELSALQEEFPNFDVKVFFNPGNGLFHPKVSQFNFSTGQSVLVIGSGNMTPGGLRANIEAYTVVTGSAEEMATLSEFDRFLSRHEANIGDINAEAIARARLNQTRMRRRIIPSERPLGVDVEEVASEIEAVQATRILVAQVPSGGDRWHQIHYNKDIIDQFFRLVPNSAQRVFLQSISLDGDPDLAVEARPLVYSEVNKNYKIEVSAKHGVQYPQGGNPPIIVFREMGTRLFNYVLVMPDERGYDVLLELSNRLPTIGKGLRRAITDYTSLRNAWAACPL